MEAEASDKPPSQEGENEETFSDEIKDYAKSTMNELLGIFGYEDQMSEEAVEDLAIQVPPVGNLASKPAQPVPIKAGPSGNSPVAMEVVPGSLPVIVKVEGNVGGSKLLNQDKGKSDVDKASLDDSAVVRREDNGNESTPKPLAPHFFTSPPRVQGLYCVVARLPVVEGSSKNVMTFKFWNCIMCSGYFTDKPEVIFRDNHPCLFVGQPVWLYQAAVCQKCHHTLVTSRSQMQLESSPGKFYAITTATKTTMVQSADDQQNGTVQNAGNDLAAPPMEERFIADPQSSQAQLECFICSNFLPMDSSAATLRRSRFPSLFCGQPEDVGLMKICQSCYGQLNQQRKLFIKNGIQENCRDYAAHIKIWTGSDKFFALDQCSVSTCFVCEKVLTNISGSSSLVDRPSFPQIFRNFPSSVVCLSTCAGCMEKLRQLQMESTASCNPDYLGHINNWREKKGLPPFSSSC